jgi:hypothetical protein
VRHVYFIKPVGMSGPIKIGVSVNPAARLADLQPCSPVPLEIVAQMPGDFTVERSLHEAFRDHHSHGEWFRVSVGLLRVIDEVNAGTFDPAGLPEPGYPIWYNFEGKRGRPVRLSA